MNKNTVHEIANYLHQIISNAQYIEDNSSSSQYAKKIKSAAYSIDALITDSTVKKPDIQMDKESEKVVDFTKFVGLNVLIVDDLIENIQIMESIFKTLSCNIFTAMSGEEALKLFENGCRPDIVSMDMIMPGIDGAKTTFELKKLGCGAYFIAISALKNQPHDIVSLFDCWLPKPFTSQHINGALSGYHTSKIEKKPDTTFKIKDEISPELKNEIFYLAKNGAYSELCRVIATLQDSSTKKFLNNAIKKIDFNSIINSIVSPSSDDTIADISTKGL